MQESFLAAFNKIETYRGSVSFGAWLKKIVVNRSLDHIKKRKLEFDDLDERSVADGESFTGNEFVSDGKNEEMYAARIKEAIDQLPEGYRIVLSLYLLEGYDHEEIGDILGITSSTSRSQFTRARKKLIENLNQQNAS
jgi:RNA polymerase sigma-70 factor (ECF subfamily)